MTESPLMPGRVALARTGELRGYGSLSPPFHPDEAFPELAGLPGGAPPLLPHNPIYRAVRQALMRLGLDAPRLGQRQWNPLAQLVATGGRVVIKPNLVQHFNGGRHGRGTVQSVATHASVLRPLVDYARLAVGPTGSVVLADAPQHNCELPVLQRALGYDELLAYLAEGPGPAVSLLDLRQQAVRIEDGLVVERIALAGDPRGYTVVDLGNASQFANLERLAGRLRGADYDHRETRRHHSGGRHEYLVANTVLDADLVINVPKWKTHKKSGITLTMKNLVGINGNKNYLPHYRAGHPSHGGDEFPNRSLGRRLRSVAVETGRRLLARGWLTRALRVARRLDLRTRSEHAVRAGNWHGNDTTWRMVLDLCRVVLYGRSGCATLADEPCRRVLHVVDGVVAMEGDGPMSGEDLPLGAVLAGHDMVAVDLAALQLMGFRWQGVRKVVAAMAPSERPISPLVDPGQVRLWSDDSAGRSLDQLAPLHRFSAHRAWADQLELARWQEG